MFRNAIVRLPGSNFADGLTTASLGVPLLSKVVQQHQAYCHALEQCGLTVSVLEADKAHPDSTFVEDTAVLATRTAVLTRPGAPSRRPEIDGMRQPLAKFFTSFEEIHAPGTLDGGDVCQAGNHFFIALSQRSNEAGGKQLAEILAREGFTSSVVDIRAMNNILHLKSGIAYLEGGNHLVLWEEMTARKEFAGYRMIPVSTGESYAANCVFINGRVLMPAGCPRTKSQLQHCGYLVVEIKMSEFQKMDGGLSCLSLRF